MVMKSFSSGEKIQAVDFNDNFLETQKAENILSGTLDAARIPEGVGGLIAVKSAIFAGTMLQAGVLTGGSFVVTNLSITHEVLDTANKLIISAFIGAAGTSDDRGNVGIAIHDGTGLIAIGNADGLKTRVTAGGARFTTLNANNVTSPAVTFVHTPGAGSKTYTVRAINIDIATHAISINRSETELDNAFFSRAVSSLVIQEVRV